MSIREITEFNTALTVIKNKKKYVASYFSPVVYRKTSFLGHVWTYIYAVVDFVKRKILQHNDSCANEAFRKYFEMIETISQIALTALQNLAGEYEGVRQRGGEDLSSWKRDVNRTCGSLPELIRIDDIFSIEEIIEEIRKKVEEQKNEPETFQKYNATFTPLQIQAIKKLQRIYALIVVEGQTFCSVPQEALRKIEDEKSTLSTTDNQLVERWIQAVNGASIPVTDSCIRDALESIIEDAKQRRKVQSYLFNHGMKQVAAWERKEQVRNLTTGSSYDGVTLQKMYRFLAFEKLHIKAFAIDDTRMKLIGEGATFVERWRTYKEDHDNKTEIPTLDEVPLKTVEEVKEERGSITIELPQASLDAISWKSEATRIEAQDLAIVKPVATLVSRLFTQGKTSRFLAPENLCVAPNGAVKAFYPIEEEDGGSYNDFFLFFQKLARGNLSVFRECMRLSGLYSHEINKFYLHITEQCFGLEDSSINIETEASKRAITDEKVIAEAKAELNGLMEMRQTLISVLFKELEEKELLSQFTEKQRQEVAPQLKQVVTAFMIDFHRDVGASIIYWQKEMNTVNIVGYIIKNLKNYTISDALKQALQSLRSVQ